MRTATSLLFFNPKLYRTTPWTPAGCASESHTMYPRYTPFQMFLKILASIMNRKHNFQQAPYIDYIILYHTHERRQPFTLCRRVGKGEPEVFTWGFVRVSHKTAVPEEVCGSSAYDLRQWHWNGVLSCWSKAVLQVQQVSRYYVEESEEGCGPTFAKEYNKNIRKAASAISTATIAPYLVQLLAIVCLCGGSEHGSNILVFHYVFRRTPFGLELQNQHR